MLLAPWYLLMAGVAAALTVALHFLARLRPRVALLPTARFVPERPARAPSRSLRPTDLGLLALRVLAILLAGAAFARPVPRPKAGRIARIIVVDRSRAVQSIPEARDSASALLREGDALILLDSAARAISVGAADSVRRLARVPVRGSISAALLRARRVAPELRARADSIELVIISPLVAEEWDAAMPRIRALWPGRVRVIRPVAAPAPSPGPGMDLRSAPDDPVAATVALLGARRGGAAVRIVRDHATAADSQWTRDSDRVLVQWPVSPRAGATGARTHVDSVGAVTVGEVVVVAPFVRTGTALTGRVVARWADGEVAAAERPLGAGCVRDVAIPLPGAGDLVLRESVQRLVTALATPCGGARMLDALPTTSVEQLRGTGRLAASRDVPIASDGVNRLTAGLLIAAGLLLLAEPALRRRRDT